MRKIFETLPVKTKEEIKRILKAYDKVEVVFEDGDYRVKTGTCVLANYPVDYRHIGTVCKEEVYTEEEMICNYIEEFLEYPIKYRGEKNWSVIRKLEKLRSKGKQGKVKLIGGDAFIIEIVDRGINK